MNVFLRFFPSKNDLIDLGSSVIVAVLLCVFMFIFIVVPSEVEGASMLPNFETGDRLYTLRLSHWLGGTPLGNSLGLDYKRGDVIVVDPPTEGKSLIKRIIGIPGDRIKIENGKVFLNGVEVFEPYLAKGMVTEDNGVFVREGIEFKVECFSSKGSEEDCYFAMGDNRYVSRDSREIGLIKRSWIQGKVFLRVWPLHKFGIISSPDLIKLSKDETI